MKIFYKRLTCYQVVVMRSSSCLVIQRVDAIKGLLHAAVSIYLSPTYHSTRYVVVHREVYVFKRICNENIFIQQDSSTTDILLEKIITSENSLLFGSKHHSYILPFSRFISRSKLFTFFQIDLSAGSIHPEKFFDT